MPKQPFLAPKTIEAKTRNAYLNRATKQLLPAVRRMFLDDSPDSIVQYLQFIAQERRHATLRQYRAALIYYLSGIKAQHGADPQVASSIDAAIDAIRKVKSSKRKDLPVRTSSAKRKYIKQKEVLELVTALAQSGKWGAISNEYIMANIIAGLRPSEWAHASMIQHAGRYVLTVRNGKNSNGRATGEFRWMLIPHEAARYVQTYIDRIASLQSEGFDIDRINTLIRRRIRKYAKKLFGKNVFITPYTIRHQFSANAKNVYTQAEVAVLHGHRSDRTATIHYGRRRSGFEEFQTYWIDSMASLEKILNDAIMTE